MAKRFETIHEHCVSLGNASSAGGAIQSKTLFACLFKSIGQMFKNVVHRLHGMGKRFDANHEHRV